MSKQKPDPEPINHAGTSLIVSTYDQLPQSMTSKPVCTWPLDTVWGRALLHQTIVGKNDSIWDACEKGPMEFRVQHLAAHYGEFESEESPGEIVAGPKISIVGPGGAYHTGSQWVWDSLRQLALIEGPPPWDPPVVLRAERLLTRNRRTRMALVYVGRDGQTTETPHKE
jgi:hypothetical protein